MWDEEIFALQWLETEDIYQALDLVFIEDKRSYKLSLKGDKDNGVVVAVKEEEID